jgi:hypothetical protein
LKSPTARKPVPPVSDAMEKVGELATNPSAVPSRTYTVLLLYSIRSCLPSPLKSPAKRLAPNVALVALAVGNVPVPLLSRMVRPLEVLGKAMSTKPSPLKSPRVKKWVLS